MELQMQMMDPEIATDYVKLGELQQIDTEEALQEQLFDELAEVEAKNDAGECL